MVRTPRPYHTHTAIHKYAAISKLDLTDRCPQSSRMPLRVTFCAASAYCLFMDFLIVCSVGLALIAVAVLLTSFFPPSFFECYASRPPQQPTDALTRDLPKVADDPPLPIVQPALPNSRDSLLVTDKHPEWAGHLAKDHGAPVPTLCSEPTTSSVPTMLSPQSSPAVRPPPPMAKKSTPQVLGTTPTQVTSSSNPLSKPLAPETSVETQQDAPDTTSLPAQGACVHLRRPLPARSALCGPTFLLCAPALVRTPHNHILLPYRNPVWNL